MKKIFGLLLFMFCMGIASQASATSAAVWESKDAFLKAEGQTCEVATDGCNTITIVNGKAGIMTQMWCEDVYGENGQESWSCLQYKEEKQPVEMFCTMEYAPVCWVNNKTYGNACGATSQGVEIAYGWQCSDYVDQKLFKRYDVLRDKYTKIIENIDEEKLPGIIDNIDLRIEATKKSRIAREMQIRRITAYMWLKNLIIEAQQRDM